MGEYECQCEQCQCDCMMGEVDEVDEAGWCEDCVDAEFEHQKAYWLPLYLGEKLAGFVR